MSISKSRSVNYHPCLRVSLSTLLLFAVWLVLPVSSHGQEKLTTPIKFDEFWYLKTEDEMARLDRFAEQLWPDQNLRGQFVGYLPADWCVGSYLRDLYGYHDYLLNKRGVRSDQLKVVYGGIRSRPMTELWLVPTGTAVPIEATKLTLDLSMPVLFDKLYLGPDCWSEVSIKLEEPVDAMRFFAEALNANPTAKGYILIHPSSREPSRNARKLATTVTQLLKQHAISERAMVGFESPRHCQEIGFWLVPAQFMSAQGTTIESAIQYRLMTYAETNQHTVRRVEFVGNTYTRDNKLRNRIPGLQEGEIFRTAVLKRSLTSLSGLRTIKPVHMQDVDVRLDRTEKTIDLSISLTDISHRPR